MIRYLRSRGTAVVAGGCLRQNGAMTKLARGLGFTATPSDEGETLAFALELQPTHPPDRAARSTNEATPT